MTEATADGTPVLIANLDLGMAAGGYYYDEPGGGGGGPSAEETEIENMFANWSAAYTGVGDEWTSYMADGAMFWDRDEDGYYDHLERGADGGVYIYNPVTDSWEYRKYNYSD